MNIADIVTPDRIALDVEVASKKKALEYVSELLSKAQPGFTGAEIFDCLLGRERLGSTGLGKGIAIPHCRLPGNHLTVGALVRLKQGIDFDSVDGKPVDLVFAMVVPEDASAEHLKTLAQLAKLFSNESLLAALHQAGDAAGLLQVITNGASLQ